MSNTEQEESSGSSDDEFFEDQQQDLTTFPSEIYNISSLELVTSSTPSVSPNISPNSLPKVGHVKAFSSIFQNLETENSSISNRTSIKLESKMSKTPRIRRAYNKFQTIINTELDELQKALDENETKAIKDRSVTIKTHRNTLEKDLARLEEEEVEATEEEDLDDIKLEMKTLIAKMSVNISKTKDHLDASSKSTAIAGKITRVDIPTFHGDYLKYKHYKSKFKTLTSTYDEISQRVFLVDHSLKGEAYSYVEDLIVHGGTLKTIWEQLDGHYGNENHIIDATISAFFQQEKPNKDINKFEEYYIQCKNRAANLIALGHSPEELLAAYFMLQIPGEYRSEIERRLSNTKADRTAESKYNFTNLTPLVEDFTRIMKMANNDQNKTTNVMLGMTNNTQIQQGNTINIPEDLTTYNQTSGYTVNSQANSNNNISTLIGQTQTQQNQYQNQNQYIPQYQNQQSRGRGYNGARGYGYYNRNNSYRGSYNGYNNNISNRANCQLCGKLHYLMYCTEYRHGPEMRKKLKEINRCDVCLVTADNHGSECQKANFPCKTCYSKDHETITCDGNTHPGSWIINKK